MFFDPGIQIFVKTFEMTAKKLIQELTEITCDNIAVVESFKKLSYENLNYRDKDDSWSILECIEHLNRYGDFYIPEIKQRIKNSNTKK